MALGLLDAGHTPVLAVLGAVDVEGDPGPAGADPSGHRVGDEALDRAHLGPLGHGTQLAHARVGIVQQLLEVIEFQFDEIPSWSQAAAAVGELADDAGRAIGVMGAGTGGRRALDLLHIDVNRLGLNPAEECIAGLCARQLLTGGAVPPAQPSAAVG